MCHYLEIIEDTETNKKYKNEMSAEEVKKTISKLPRFSLITFTGGEAFMKNDEMVLTLDDFAVFVANWNNKVDNIKSIKSVLNIGYDSMVFVDDNPVERELVKSNSQLWQNLGPCKNQHFFFGS